MSATVFRYIGLGIIFALCAGCATSDVVPVGGGAYMVTRHVYGFTGTSHIKAELLKVADEFCRSRGKEILVTKTVEIGLKFGRESAAEVYFFALDPADPRLKNPPAIQEISK